MPMSTAEIRALENQLENLDQEVKSLAKSWYKPALLNLGIVATIITIGLSVQYHRDENLKEEISDKAAQTNGEFSLRYEKAADLVKLKHNLALEKIRNVDEKLENHKQQTRRELDRLQRNN